MIFVETNTKENNNSIDTYDVVQEMRDGGICVCVCKQIRECERRVNVYVCT